VFIYFIITIITIVIIIYNNGYYYNIFSFKRCFLTEFLDSCLVPDYHFFFFAFAACVQDGAGGI
jgi:hypothetical protein